MAIQTFDQQIEKINATLDRVAASQAKTDEQIRKNGKDIQALKVSQEKTDEQLKVLRVSQEKTDEQIRKNGKGIQALRVSQEKTERVVRETSRKVDEVARRYGDAENNKGRVVEEHFYQYFLRHPYLKDIHFDEIHRNFYSTDRHEHDIVMLNHLSAGVFSVKYVPSVYSVDYLIYEERPRISAYLRNIKGIETIYLGIAGEYVPTQVQRYAEERGLFVLSQSGENATMLNSERFSPKGW